MHTQQYLCMSFKFEFSFKFDCRVLLITVIFEMCALTLPMMARNQESVLKTIFTLIEMSNDRTIHTNYLSMCVLYVFNQKQRSIAKHFVLAIV